MEDDVHLLEGTELIRAGGTPTIVDERAVGAGGRTETPPP